jgi:hypothetical protein
MLCHEYQGQGARGVPDLSVDLVGRYTLVYSNGSSATFANMMNARITLLIRGRVAFITISFHVTSAYHHVNRSLPPSSRWHAFAWS